MYNPFSLEGKTILVTGASSGIGRQCAIDFSKMGAKVVLVARNRERLKETILMMKGDGHVYFIYDFSDLSGIKGLVTSLSGKGKLDGFVHSAGVQMTKPMKLLNVEDYDNLYRINTLSGFEMARYLSSVNNFNKGGSIIFISSITAVIARSGLAAYAASKGAMISAAKVMALELAKRNIRVNTVSPGTILSPLMESYLSTLNEGDYKRRVGGFPLGLGECSDISNACIYLLSDAARWVTGHNLIVDGGYTAQ